MLALYSLLVGGATLYILSKQNKALTLSPIFVLNTSLPKEPNLPTHAAFQKLVAVVGVAQTDLRPVGRALLQGKGYDVISVEGFIEEHQTIVVERVVGTTIYVKRGVDIV